MIDDFVLTTNNGVHMQLDTTWHLIELEFQSQIMIANVHVSKCVKNMLWLMKFLDLAF
jgi:hypothetical protein